MVSHSIIIKGGALKGATHTIEGQSELRCSYAVLTSVVVQTTTGFRQIVPATYHTAATVAASEADPKPAVGDELTAAYDAGHGLYGVSIKFPGTCVPPGATHHSGADNEHRFENRLDVHFSQDGQTFMYKPGLILQGVTFTYKYDVTLYRIGNPDTLLTPDEVAKIHSITLNFSATVEADMR